MRLNVAYACGDDYARHAGVSMISLFENNREFEEIYVYLIDNNLSNEMKDILTNITDNYSRDIKFIKLKDLCGDFDADIDNGRYTLSTYSKLFFGRLDIDKIIYLDCDTTFNDSLADLWRVDISDYYIAGVWDDAAPRFKKAVSINKDELYINAGFVLMNLENWRKNNLEEKSLNFIKNYKGSVPFLDQGVINAICKNHILLLPPQYDLMCYMLMYKAKQINLLCGVNSMYSQKEIDYAINNPIMIHWVTGSYNRPWNINCTHPLKEKYNKYLNMSPWAGMYENNKLSKKAKLFRYIYILLPFTIFHQLRSLSDKIKGRRFEKEYSN